MATILDVARLAGVSQGTVSNVLNRKGNVSSEKIRLVEEAARTLGFTINEKARLLRKGSSDSIAVILPDLQCRQYRDFYASLRTYAERNGYSTELMITNDHQDEELALIRQARADLKEGIVLISCLGDRFDAQMFNEIQKVCFVERHPAAPGAYYGFDYPLCGKELASSLSRRGYHDILLVHGPLCFSNEKEIVRSFTDHFSDADCSVTAVSTDMLRLPYVVMEVFETYDDIDAIVTTNFGFAEKIRQIGSSLLLMGGLPIYTISPVFALPENDYRKYELNYSLLGRQVAEDIIKLGKEELAGKQCILKNDGYRKWHDIALKRSGAETLSVLALEGTEAFAMKGLARLYEEKTGTKINISVFSYDEIYEALVNAENFGVFDVFRIDVTWLSWFAEKILLPLEQIDDRIADSLSGYIPGAADRFSKVNGRIYALPMTPSAQLLFYRKDLFEDGAVRRLYREQYKQDLKVPKDFGEFDQIAGFFTRAVNPASKVKYGTVLELGNTGVAATEFLTRFFSRKQDLYSGDGRVIVNGDVGLRAMNDLIEAVRSVDRRNIPWWTDAAKVFADGNVAMEIMFSSYASETLGYKSKIIDKIGYAIVPGGNPIVGGGALAIARTSRHPEDALAFIKWLTKDPMATAMAALGSVSPCLKTYDIYEIIDAFPWLELSKECFSLSRTERLPADDLRPFHEKKFLSILGGAVKNVCAGIIDAQKALDIAQALIDEQFNR